MGASERTYKRKKTVWICNDCWAERPIWLTTFLKTLLLSPIYTLLYQGYSKFGVVVGSPAIGLGIVAGALLFILLIKLFPLVKFHRSVFSLAHWCLLVREE